MTKAEIVEQIYEQVGFSKKESAELVEKVFEAIKETLANTSWYATRARARGATPRPDRRFSWRRERC
jgi:hypothetical protein